MSPLVSFSRGEHVQEVDSGRDIFPKRLIDKPFSRAMVNQRAFGKTRGKLFILEKRSRWFIKSDSPKITNGIRRKCLPFDHCLRFTSTIHAGEKEMEENVGTILPYYIF